MRPSEPNSMTGSRTSYGRCSSNVFCRSRKKSCSSGVLVEDGRKAGYTFSQPDLIIAATALHQGLTVVTRHVSDYERVRARVFNPWVDSLPASAS